VQHCHRSSQNQKAGIDRISAHTLSHDFTKLSNWMTAKAAEPFVRVLIVDDHSVVRDGLAILLERDPEIRVVAFASTGEEAVSVARRLMPRLIIMDLMLPCLNGIDATQRIISEYPETGIIALSACHTLEQVCRALRAGALGFVFKTEAGPELLHAVRAVMAGKQYLSPAIAALFHDGALNVPIPKSPFERLSGRERAVVQLIAAGSTSSDIARHLSLSSKTVDTYRARIMVKLNVANRAALIRYVLEYELPVV
jgi:DNA-binding NarL/FixJ family response regulator